jgi:uncharacterized protein (TIGR02145 family)
MLELHNGVYTGMIFFVNLHSIVNVGSSNPILMFLRLFLTIVFCWIFQFGLHAQVPQAFNYQAVCRNTNGAPILNQPVNFRVEILQGSITGTVVYAETQLDTTSAFGVSTLEIGRGTPTSGTFAGINWSNSPTYIRISFDPVGGNNFTFLGTHELLSVPYALQSGNALPQGNTANEILYWNGNSWVTLSPGSHGQAVALCNGTLTWTQSGVCPSILGLTCASAVHNGILTESITASGVNSVISYTGGNGSAHNGQTVNSTGITGLTATLNPGSFATGNGTLSYAITGTPSAAGIANFAISIGGQSCTLTRTVASMWPTGTVHCNSSTQIISVTNPTTNKTWMDRNLGATQVATNSADANAFGDLYQWGRSGDGHQCRNSGSTSTLSSTDTPGNSNFIIPPFPNTNNYDWRLNQNPNLWQGINGINNPCPSGYRLPTSAELAAERNSWTSNNQLGAFGSPLKFTASGLRWSSDGSISDEGLNGYYWSSTIDTTNSQSLTISNNSMIYTTFRAEGCSVRCIQN